MFHNVKRSISRKLVLGVLGTTLTTLLVAGSTMLVLDIRNYQTSWADDLRAQSELLAQVTTPALEFNDSKPCVCGVEIRRVDDAITVYLAGDSTVTDQPREPGIAGARSSRRSTRS